MHVTATCILATTDTKPALDLVLYTMPELMEGADGASLPEPPSMMVERTLAIIKPDAVDKVEEIVEEIRRNGFNILQVMYFTSQGKEEVEDRQMLGQLPSLYDIYSIICTYSGLQHSIQS